MNEENKPNFFFLMLLGLTMFVALQYFFAPTQEQPVRTDDVQTQRQRPAGSQQPADTAAIDAEYAPTGDYRVTVTVGEAARNSHGYEASFDSVGAGLVSYRLLGFFRLPQDDSPDNRVILLDRMAPGHDSLMLDSMSTGTLTTGVSRPPMIATNLRDLRYQLVEAPAGAKIEPEPDETVTRGENLVFRAVAGGWEIVKTYRFPAPDAADFTIRMDLAWRNLADGTRLLGYDLVGPAGMIADDDSRNFGVINILTARQASPADPSVEIERTPLSGMVNEPHMLLPDNRASLAWVGSKNRFFAALMTAEAGNLRDSNGAARQLFPGNPDFLPTAKDLADNIKRQPHVNTAMGSVPAFEETRLTVETGSIPPGQTYSASYTFYAGPAVDAYMEEADPRLHGVVTYTFQWLDFISRLLVRLLTFLDRFLGNYGLAIIAVTLLIKTLLHPLTRKTFVSMNKMSKLSPALKEIQKKYANDRLKMQQESSKFMKENGINMAGGCLPMLLQLPIFFALYGAFSQGFSMRHAAFIPGWIQDLSKPDSVYDLGFSIPWLDWSQISLLPILYLGLQLLLMSSQPKPSDPQQAQQQKMMKLMPIFFVFIFYSMPAGLVLYFTVSALYSVVENWWMRKRLLPRLGLGDSPAATAVAAASAQAGTGAAPVPSEGKKRKKKK